MSSRILAVSVAVLILGCTVNRGHFTVISAHGVPPHYRILAPSISGEACNKFGRRGNLLELAVADALAKVPQANLLASVDISVRRGLFSIPYCFQVEGAALFVEP
jgi:hypothetical protein